jgi:uncharacterized membrane protein
MADELVPRPPRSDAEDVTADPDDPGTELVADIDSRLQRQFPDLERRPEVIQTIETVVRERSFMFSGPVPPPQMLAEYERICPGWAVRILEQGEREQLARIEREREELAQTRLIIESEASDDRSGRIIESRGQILGFSAFLIIAALGGWAMYLGQTAIAIACFTTFAVGVVGLFVMGRKQESTSDNDDDDDDSH